MENEKPTIVAVDDQLPILHRIVSILRRDYHVIPFTSGQTALRYLENNTADLILLDYQMPGISGCEILEKLKAGDKGQKTPVIFLTGSEYGDAEVEVLEKGASDYILKPIKEKVLLKRIHMQLELTNYRNHLEQLVEEKTKAIKMRESITLNLLARATDMRDHNTGGHIARTTEIVRIIVMYLLNHPEPGYTLTEYEANNIIESSKLHDLGKIALPDHILLKPDKLDEAEFEIIKRHPSHGVEMLDEYISQMGKDTFLDTARDIALYHHEKWNGKGYPHGLCGADIPLSARITAIADVYDALISARPYKIPLSHDKAVQVIFEGSGSHFDPYLTEIFLRHTNELEGISSAIE